MPQNSEENHSNKNMNAQIAAAGITGALIGAGIAVVAAVALNNDKTRKKTFDVALGLRDYLLDYAKKYNINVSKKDKVKPKELILGDGKTQKSSSTSKKSA